MEEETNPDFNLDQLRKVYPDYNEKLYILPQPPQPMRNDSLVEERIDHKVVIRILTSSDRDVIKRGFLLQKVVSTANDSDSTDGSSTDEFEVEQLSSRRRRQDCCIYIPNLSKPTICVFKEVLVLKTLNKSETEDRLETQLKNLQTSLESVKCPENLRFKVVVFIVFCSKSETKSTTAGQKTDLLIQGLEEHFATKQYRNLCPIFYKLSANFQTRDKNSENCRLVHEIIEETEKSTEIYNDFNSASISNTLSAIVLLTPTEIDFHIYQKNYQLEDNEDVVFDTSLQKMSQLVDHCLDGFDQRIVTVPDFDRSNFNKLYQEGDNKNQQLQSNIHKYIGEIENFWPQFNKWIEPLSKGVLLHGYSQEELRKILNSELPFNFEFDWIYFTQSNITVFEAGLHFSKDEEKIIRDKLLQVFTKIIPAFQIILWFFRKHLFGVNNSVDQFTEFFTNHFTVIVFLADVNDQKVEKLLTNVLSKLELLDFDLTSVPDWKLKLVHFVGSSSQGPKSGKQFCNILKDENGFFTVETRDRIYFDVEEDSDINKSVSVEEKSTVSDNKSLIGLFALSYLCNDENFTVRQLNQSPEKLDNRFQRDLNFFLRLKSRLIKETFRKALDTFNLALSPQQLEILEEDPKTLIVRGEPGCGKTILLLAKALEAALDENVDHIYFCTPENKDELKKYIAEFIEQENFKDSYEKKFTFLTNRNLLNEVNRKRPRELRRSVLLMDEFYFDSGEDLGIEKETFFNICISKFPHLRNCWIASIVVNYYWQWIEILPTYLPVELFCVKPLNIQFRSSRHIANFCTNFHHQGKLKGFASCFTPGVFTSSDIEVKRHVFSDQSDLDFIKLNPKFNSDRWAIVYCEKSKIETWRSYLQANTSFTSVYVIEASAGSSKCTFSGAEVFSVVLIIDDVDEKKTNQAKNSPSDAMYKLAMSRAQYELVLFIHRNLESKYEEFEQSAKTDFFCPEKSTAEWKIYNTAVQKLKKDDVPKLLQDLGLQIDESLIANFVTGETNRKILANLGKQFGQDIVRFMIDFSIAKTSLASSDAEKTEEAESRERTNIAKSSTKQSEKLIETLFHAMRSNNGNLLVWVFRLIEETDSLGQVEPHLTQILLNSCFKPDLMKQTWRKLDSWGLLQSGLRSKVKIWGQNCGMLTIMCYANSPILNIETITSNYLLDKFFGKNALHYSIEHNNFKNVELLLKNNEMGRELLREIETYSNNSVVQIAKSMSCDGKIIEFISKRSKTRLR